MPEPEMRSQLERYADRFAALAGEPLTIRGGRPLAQINLRGDANDSVFKDAVQTVAGCGFPGEANTVSRSATGDRSIAWLGPDEWLLVGGEGEGPALCADLAASLTGRHASTLDVSANRMIIEVSGSGARDLLAKGCSLDLHSREFAADDCAQTLLAHVQIILEQVDDAPTFRIYVRPSFSRYLADWLLKAAAGSGSRGAI